MKRWLPHPKRYFLAVLQLVWIACQAHQAPSDVVFAHAAPVAQVEVAQ